jgi:hypothetical protein
MVKAICNCWLVGVDTRLPADIVADAATEYLSRVESFDPQKYTHAMTLKEADKKYNERFLLCGFKHNKLTNNGGNHGVGYVYIKDEQPSCPACLFMLRTVVIDREKEIL